jgi:hypothetical protein
VTLPAEFSEAAAVDLEAIADLPEIWQSSPLIIRKPQTACC